MKHIRKTIFTAIALSCFELVATPAATTSWVSNYVDKAVAAKTCMVSNTADATYYYTGGMTMKVEVPSVYSLMATNATSAAVTLGVTNGMYFVWNSPIHSYTNKTQTIVATKTNLVWGSVQSIGSSFSNYFDVVSRILQQSYAKEVTK